MTEREFTLEKNLDELKDKLAILEEKSLHNLDEHENRMRILEGKIDEIIKCLNEFSSQMSAIIPDIDKRLINLESKGCKCNNEECESEPEEQA